MTTNVLMFIFLCCISYTEYIFPCFECSKLSFLFHLPILVCGFLQVAKERNITVNLRHHLLEVKPDTREAVFQDLENPDDLKTLQVRVGICTQIHALYVCMINLNVDFI